MAIFEEEPGDYIPPPPWEPEQEQNPAIQETYGETPQPPGDSWQNPAVADTYQPQAFPNLTPANPAEPYQPVQGQFNPSDPNLSERMLQEQRLPVFNPYPLPPPYFIPGEAWQIPESMYQQGKGYVPRPQYQESVNFTPTGYRESITSPSNWQTPRYVPQQEPFRRTGGGGGYGGYGGYSAGGAMDPKYLINLLRYAGLLRI